MTGLTSPRLQVQLATGVPSARATHAFAAAMFIGYLLACALVGVASLPALIAAAVISAIIALSTRARLQTHSAALLPALFVIPAALLAAHGDFAASLSLAMLSAAALWVGAYGSVAALSTIFAVAGALAAVSAIAYSPSRDEPVLLASYLWILVAAAGVCLEFIALSGLRRETALAAQIRRESHRHETAARLAQRAAQTDALTGLVNRGEFEAQIAQAAGDRRHTGGQFSVILMDIDHFKSTNDTQGHAAGDDLLKSVATRWSRVVRDQDVLARLGGDEFVLLMLGADIDEAVATAERLRGSTPMGVTASIGVAAREGSDSPARVIANADAALYAAKRAGRDCVRRFDPVPLA